jgi:hypothetical protein
MATGPTKKAKSTIPTANETRQLSASTEEKNIDAAISMVLGAPRLEAISKGRNYVDDYCPSCLEIPRYSTSESARLAECRKNNHPWTIHQPEPVKVQSWTHDALILHFDATTRAKAVSKLEQLGYSVQQIGNNYTYQKQNYFHPTHYRISW